MDGVSFSHKVSGREGSLSQGSHMLMLVPPGSDDAVQTREIRHTFIAGFKAASSYRMAERWRHILAVARGHFKCCCVRGWEG